MGSPVSGPTSCTPRPTHGSGEQNLGAPAGSIWCVSSSFRTGKQRPRWFGPDCSPCSPALVAWLSGWRHLRVRRWVGERGEGAVLQAPRSQHDSPCGHICYPGRPLPSASWCCVLTASSDLRPVLQVETSQFIESKGLAQAHKINKNLDLDTALLMPRQLFPPYFTSYIAGCLPLLLDSAGCPGACPPVPDFAAPDHKHPEGRD